mmetsp:Transcript_871/g.2701  ORF Transcript_871/g.2701 Transcript_871/m.2701 type:complete len:267 (+) Transcript_871:74-874(+)
MWIKLPYICASIAAMASLADAFAPSTALLRSRSNMRSLARAGPAAVRIRAAKEQPDQVIDFGKVGFSDAENQMRSLVFQPEEGETEPESRCRVNWDIKLEQALNDHINVEYTASYAYHALFSYFDRDTVALKGFAKFFADQSQEERGHAEQFMKYQNTRGGKVVLKPLAVPDMQFSRVDGTSDALYAFELALMLEKFVYRKLLDLHALGAECEDPQFCDEIENYLGDQVRAIKTMAEYVAQIKRVGTGHGVWDLDKKLEEEMQAAA